MLITPKSQIYALLADFPSRYPGFSNMLNNIRFPSPWAQLFLFIGLIAATFIFFNVFAVVIYQLAGIPLSSAQALSDIRSIDVGKVIQTLYTIVQFGLTAWIFGRIVFKKDIAVELGLRRSSGNSYYLLAILLLLFALPLENWLGELNKHLPLFRWMVSEQSARDQQVEIFVKVHHPFDPVINLLVMAAIPAFCEEICFRGVLQRIMIRICRRPVYGILAAAVLFSVFHFQFEGFIPRVFLGVLLGAAYWYSGSLWVAIVAHFFFNAIQITAVMYFPDVVAKYPLPFYMVILSFLFVVGLLAFMRRRSPTSYAAVYES